MLRRLASLRAVERRALAEALLGVASVRIRLGVQPLARVLEHVRRRSDRASAGPRPEIPVLVWAVRASGRRLLWKNPCLTEAIALWGLLRRHGYESRIRIGVARHGAGSFEAHAWVERDGEVLIGGPRSPETYVPLPVFDQP